ncbi:MAG TPA: dienelactone hydrolase family protein [Acidobacteriaceae bacterium]
MKRLIGNSVLVRAALTGALSFGVLGMVSATAGAQDWAKANLAKSPRHGEFVTITEAGGRKLQAWVVYPEVKGKAPVVVMIHEIYGQTDWAREMADEVAGAGYIVVEPDLLSGFGPVAPNIGPSSAHPAPGMGCDPMPCTAKQTEDHRHMQAAAGPGAAFGPASPGGTAAFPDQSAVTRAVSNLDPSIVTADLDAAADYGKKLPAANGKLFVAGFCWGGGKSFAFATHRKDLSGAMVFYGSPPPVEAMKDISAPVYGFYAGNDARISATVPDTTTAMKAAGKTYEPVVYDGAGHGFMRAGEAPDASAANAAARAAGFRRLVELLGGVR